MKIAALNIISIGFFTILYSCAQPKDDTIEINFQLSANPNAQINISAVEMLTLNWSPIAETTLDSTGKGSLKFPINGPIVLSLNIDDVWCPLYLEPGYNLNITTSGDTISLNTILYSGLGGEVNEYNRDKNIIVNEFQKMDSKDMFDLQPDEFFIRINTLNDKLSKRLQELIDNTNLSSNTRLLLGKINKAEILWQRQSYNYAYNMMNNYSALEQLDISNEMLYDSMLLTSGLFQYALIFQLQTHLKAGAMLREYASLDDGLERVPLLMTNKLSAITNPYLNEFLHGKNIYFWLLEYGIRGPIDSLYQEYAKNYSHSIYFPSVEKLYAKTLTIPTGQPAPEIKGITIEGDSVSSVDFKNKVIYVDVWASWCGPCIAEIPASTILQQKFSETDPIVFLNVSIDSQTSDWEKALSKYPTWGGKQILNNGTIRGAYDFQELPRYILIDKEGKIANIDAPRPSSTEIESEILKLLY